MFYIQGTVEGMEVNFSKTQGNFVTYHCHGRLDSPTPTEIRGSWGTKELGGKFRLRRIPANWYLVRPRTMQQMPQNRAQARWMWVFSMLGYSRKAPSLHTSCITERRRLRQQYTDLILRPELQIFQSRAAEEWVQLLDNVHPRELCLWRLRAAFIAPRRLSYP